ncbi:MAG: hypothetical protein Q8K67_12565 [Geothrix sp.]|nr:hypothetical protein [Geothrix sp.]
MPVASITLVSALIAWVLVMVLGRWLGPRGWMDQPSARKRHDRPVPRVGGLVLLTVLVGAELLGGSSLGLSALERTAVLGMGGMGALDDRFNLRARWKAIVGLLLAIPLATGHTWALLHSGINMTLFGLDIPDHALVFFPLLTMWYWAVPHAFNLIDGLNGLSLGFSCLLLAALSLSPGFLLGAGAAPLWGVLVALLALNFPRARHFLGDAGSLALGTLFAILVMNQALPVHRGLALWLMAYPVLDVTTVVAIRLYTRRPLGRADRSHLHHWLLDHLKGRAWLVTPLLLFLAALPMTRDLDGPWAKVTSSVGFIALALLAAVVFVDRAIRKPAVPTLLGKPSHPFLNDPSGSHPQA